MDRTAIKNLLDEKYRQFNSTGFIESDPVSIPHLFSKKADIEISGFLTAVISWGQRPVILKNAKELMRRMDNDPSGFIAGFTKNELKPFESFVHRTFQGTDCIFFLKSLQRIYLKYSSIENLLIEKYQDTESLMQPIVHWRKTFFGKNQGRSLKHFSDPSTGSAAKRINMFLRWMIRRDPHGVDFGIWKRISPASLTCPLDVHSARVGRKLGLLSRQQNDWKAARELTDRLRQYDAHDPVKYDFALFGLGVFEKF